MKFIIFFLLISCSATAQNIWLLPSPAGGWTKPNSSYGDIKARGTITTFMGIPTIESPPSGLTETYDLQQAGVAYCLSDHSLYIWEPEIPAWVKYTGGGGSDSSFVLTVPEVLDGTQNLLTIPHTLSVQPTRIEVTVDDEQGIPTFVQPYADATNVYIQLSTGRHCTCEYSIRVTP